MKCVVFATGDKLFIGSHKPSPYFSNHVLVIKYCEIRKNVETFAIHHSAFCDYLRSIRDKQ